MTITLTNAEYDLLLKQIADLKAEVAELKEKPVGWRNLFRQYTLKMQNKLLISNNNLKNEQMKLKNEQMKLKLYMSRYKDCLHVISKIRPLLDKIPFIGYGPLNEIESLISYMF